MNGEGVKRVADPVINSAEELRAALNAPDRARWERQLAILAAHDSSYHRFFCAHDVLDYLALGRLVRRGMAKRNSAQFNNEVFGPSG